MLDDIERAVDDGVNSYKLLGKDARAVAAGGATEIEIARQLQQWGRKVGGEGQGRGGPGVVAALRWLVCRFGRLQGNCRMHLSSPGQPACEPASLPASLPASSPPHLPACSPT